MTAEKLAELNKANNGIKRLDDILWYMERTGTRGINKIVSKTTKHIFRTAYGSLDKTISLEPDEFDALQSYMESKRDRLIEYLDKEDI